MVGSAKTGFRGGVRAATARREASILYRAWIISLAVLSTTIAASATAWAFDVDTAKSVDTGFQIWTTETFNGNGRKCGTCHISGHNYTISPADIAALSPADHALVLGGTNTTLENPTLVENFALFNISDTTPGAPGNTLTPMGPFRTSMQIGGLGMNTSNECPNTTSIATATTSAVPTAQVTTLAPPPYPFAVGQQISIGGVDVAGYNGIGGLKITSVINPTTFQYKKAGGTVAITGLPDGAGGVVIGLPATGAGVCSTPPNFVTFPVDTGTRFIELGWAGDGAPVDPTLFTPSGTTDFNCQDTVDASNANPHDLASVLATFSMGAVRHHFALTDARVPGVDFRCPTNPELKAMVAFQMYLGRQYPSGTPLELALREGTTFPGTQMSASQPVVSFTDATAEKGKDIFLDPHAGCQFCHFNAGASLSASQIRTEPYGDPPLPFPGRNENEQQNVDVLTNTTFHIPSTGQTVTGGLDGLTPVTIGRDPGDGAPIGGVQVPTGISVFNVQSIIEAPRKKSFFHNGVFATSVEDAISFYFTDPFAFNLNTAAFTAPTKQTGGTLAMAPGLPNPLPRGTGQPEGTLPGGPALALQTLAGVYFPSDPGGGQEVLDTMGFFLRALSVVYSMVDCERLLDDSISRVGAGLPLTVPVLNCTNDLSDVERVIAGARVNVPAAYQYIQNQIPQLQDSLQAAADQRDVGRLSALVTELRNLRNSVATISPDLPRFDQIPSAPAPAMSLLGLLALCTLLVAVGSVKAARRRSTDRS
jgi:hypothetical protein